ncbi:hypothetical protein MTO96_046118 [Rhipicephalus appendiculatus]
MFHAGKSVVDFANERFLDKNVSSVSEPDLIKCVLPVDLRRTSAKWLPLLCWENFVMAFQEQFLPTYYEYHTRRCLYTRTPHLDDGLWENLRTMHELIRNADPSAHEAIQVSHVLRWCHPCFRPYAFWHFFFLPRGTCCFARQIAETLL